jgi:riboflavin synthase
MFTGIITDVGKVAALEQAGDVHLTIDTHYDLTGVDIGASIACSGICLTVVSKSDQAFTVTASKETLDCSNLGDWQVGGGINLERALKVGDEIGGHIVSGHVDGVGKVVAQEPEGESVRFTFEAPDDIKQFIASKGSVCVNGVSLTVNEVDDNRFGVNLIPHTLEMTTFGAVSIGDRVNLEIDMLARYVARLLDKE